MYRLRDGRILTARVNAARQLLETTNTLVADIATACGFYDQSHFTRAFIQERGIAPGTYRRQHTARAADSTAMEPVIFEAPARRSEKVMGISAR